MASHPLLALHAAVVLFGLAGLFGRWVLLPPQVLVLGRTAFAAATLALVMRMLGQPIGRPTWGLALNALMLALHWVTFFAAIQQGSVAIGVLGYASFPLWVLVLDGISARHMSLADAGIACMVTAGLALLASDATDGVRHWDAVALAIASGASFAMLIVANRRQARVQSPLAISLWQNAGAAALLLASVLVLGVSIDAITARDVAALAVLGIVCTALAHTLFIGSLRRASAHTASIVAALEPVYGMAFAALLLGELASLRACGAAALLVGAAILATARGVRATRFGRATPIR